MALAVDDAGRVFLSGSVNGSVRIGGADQPIETDILLYAAQLDPAGEELRAGLFGCSNGHVPRLVYRSGASQDVAFGANFRRIASLGGESFMTAAMDDVIVARLVP